MKTRNYFFTTKKMYLFVNLFTIFMLAWSTNHVVYAAPQASANQLTGNTYYVSTSGSDSNPGTEAQPWRTIGKAGNSVAAGDTVYIRGGSYKEVVSLSRSGTASLPIKFLAYPGETPIVDGDNYRLPTSSWGTILTISGSYVQISGLEVSGKLAYSPAATMAWSRIAVSGRVPTGTNPTRRILAAAGPPV
jgi:hypothetical protein